MLSGSVGSKERGRATEPREIVPPSAFQKMQMHAAPRSVQEYSDSQSVILGAGVHPGRSNPVGCTPVSRPPFGPSRAMLYSTDTQVRRSLSLRGKGNQDLTHGLVAP